MHKLVLITYAYLKINSPKITWLIEALLYKQGEEFLILQSLHNKS